MNTYTMELDGGQGGSDTTEADSVREALVSAIAWAREGDWGDGDCDVLVRVTSDEDEDDTAEATIHIPSAEEEQDAELEDDGEVLGKDEGEYSTEQIVRMYDASGDAEYYYMHPNGGSRGAWDRQGGDGEWHEAPCTPTRQITRQQAIGYLLDWGYTPDDVAKKMDE